MALTHIPSVPLLILQWTGDLIGLRTLYNSNKIIFSEFKGNHLRFNDSWWDDEVRPVYSSASTPQRNRSKKSTGTPLSGLSDTAIADRVYQNNKPLAAVDALPDIIVGVFAVPVPASMVPQGHWA